MWFCVVIPKPLPTPIHWKVSNRVDVSYGNREIHPETAWQRIPKAQTIRQGQPDIRIFILPGFDIARKATSRQDLQLRMQGNSFLGRLLSSFFFSCRTIRSARISSARSSRKQYDKKFGRFGDAVVESNMEVMTQGFNLTQEIHLRRVR